MPTDPVQVVAGEFRGLMRRFAELGYVDGTWEHQEAMRFVAALKAAGALMPEEAAELANELRERETEWAPAVRMLEEANDENDELTALLQEALSVLGRQSHGPVAVGSGEECKCGQLLPCPEASLAERVEKAIGGEG